MLEYIQVMMYLCFVIKNRDHDNSESLIKQATEI